MDCYGFLPPSEEDTEESEVERFYRRRSSVKVRAPYTVKGDARKPCGSSGGSPYLCTARRPLFCVREFRVGALWRLPLIVQFTVNVRPPIPSRLPAWVSRRSVFETQRWPPAGAP
eukprot:8773776-Pyramimonas_sp.AAC.1